MSVLKVASGQVKEGNQQRPSTASDTNGQSSGDGAERIDLAGQLSNAAEDFVTGLIPGDTSVNINWGALSPLFSVVGDVAGILGLLVGWL